MVRNPQDAILSFSRFAGKHLPSWFELWGGIPPLVDDVDEVIDSQLGRFEMMAPIPFFKEWYEYKDDPNVLLLHYADVFKDQNKYIRLIADFIGLKDITEEGFREVERRTTVEFMKSHNHRYTHIAGRNRNTSLLSADALVRKGGIGTSKRGMTEEQSKRIHEIALEYLGPNLTNLLEHGGFSPLTN